MPDDSDPIPTGTTGAVKAVRQCRASRDTLIQVDVDSPTLQGYGQIIAVDGGRSVNL